MQNVGFLMMQVNKFWALQTAKACFTLICLCDFCHRPQNIETVRQIADNFTQNHTERNGAVQCLNDYLMSHARLPQDGHAKFERLSQDKTICHPVPALQP